jgi:hypothetical protein
MCSMWSLSRAPQPLSYTVTVRAFLGCGHAANRQPAAHTQMARATMAATSNYPASPG